MKYKSIYVAASSQHVGKTTSTLGLVSNFMQKGLKVGYCKPVGQQYLDLGKLRVDKDTLLFMDLIHFNVIPEIHSPIILGHSAVTDYIENPDQYDLLGSLLYAKEQLEEQNELIIYEGTGHPGVGSVANLSNAKVAKMMNAGLILVVEGGIGSTIDMLNLSLSMFREKNLPIFGIIVNKVIPDKMEKVAYYVGKYLQSKNLPLLGVIPYDKSLAYPVMRTITKAVKGKVMLNEEMTDNKIEDIIAGSLLHTQNWTHANDLLLVVATNRFEGAINRITRGIEKSGLETCPIAGVVVCGEGDLDETSLDFIKRENIPMVRTRLDTFGSVIRISQIEVKINRSTPWKVNKAIELIRENIQLENLLVEI